MSSPSHWNPFKTLLRVPLHADVEGYLRGFGPHVVWTDVQAGTPGIRLDVREDDATYRIEADVPGAAREDIELSVDGNTISIRARIKRGSPQKENAKEICSERHGGELSRTFSLPAEVDGAKAQASYENGVLSVTLPKKLHAQARRISIA